jgi:hypothetical protein
MPQQCHDNASNASCVQVDFKLQAFRWPCFEAFLASRGSDLEVRHVGIGSRCDATFSARKRQGLEAALQSTELESDEQAKCSTGSLMAGSLGKTETMP